MNASPAYLCRWILATLVVSGAMHQCVSLWITVAPVRVSVLNRGQTYTLKCNASGDPRPKITWTKDGVPVNQFNVSGYFLHLVNVQRKDAGSYRCTASNGYGKNATSVSIVGIFCTRDCTTKKAEIIILSETWKHDLYYKDSIEYKTLESKLLSAIWSVYTKNPEKQPYRVAVDGFMDFYPGFIATVELLFDKSATEPLKPLEDEVNDGKLSPFTVDRRFVQRVSMTPFTVRSTALTTVGTKSTETAVKTTVLMPVKTTTSTTDARDGLRASTTDARSPSGLARDTGTHGSSGLTNSEKGGIIGGCIAFGFVIAIIVIFIRYIYKKRKNSSGSWTQMT